MAAIRGSVGKRGLNSPDDVRTVQKLLNDHMPIPYRLLKISGECDSPTIAAIEEFQRRVVRMFVPDGRIDAGGKTWHALAGGGPAELSGAAWWHANQAKFANSTSVEDLEPTFRVKVKEFLKALADAKADVRIATTRRSKQRAYLMHYSWQIAKGNVAPSKVPAEPGVSIRWDHGDLKKSKAAAQEMVELFDMAHIAALNSNHIRGLAIDMRITWSGTIQVKNKSGAVVDVGAPNQGADNTKLHAVGATYGVLKLVSDPPHWSSDGR